MIIHKDCRHYKGYKPCSPHKEFGVECDGCQYFDQITKKILIINTIGIGDVIRATSLLQPLRQKYPGCQISWLTSKLAFALLEDHPLIDRVFEDNHENMLRLEIEQYDLVVNLDKDDKYSALTTRMKAKLKRGFGLGEDGHIHPLDDAAHYLWIMGVSDNFKRANKKTHQEIIFNIAGLNYNKEKSQLPLTQEAIKHADFFFEKNGIKPSDIVVGFNTGSSGRLFAHRAWRIHHYVKLAELLHKNLGVKIVLLGGPEEVEKNKKIMEQSVSPIIDAGTDNTLQEFIGIIGLCDLIVSGDTMAGHVAAALDVPLILMFGSTNPDEIEIYDNGKKILSSISCVKCYLRKCDKELTCMDLIKPDQIMKNVIDVLIEKGLLKEGRNMEENDNGYEIAYHWNNRVRRIPSGRVLIK